MDKDRAFQTAKVAGWAAVFFLLVYVDQAFKVLAKNPFLNGNFAFSLPLPTWLIYLVYALVLCFAATYLFRQRRQMGVWQGIGWLLIWAGAFSNIGERIVLGHVRDFIYITLFGQTGIYNLADGYILLGIIILLLKEKQTKKPV